jgi:hypothetical protein
VRFNIKIWSWQHAVNCAQDWFIDPADCADIGTALTQPFRVAAVPVMFNCPGDFTYTPDADTVDLSQFDLVLLSDIEYRPREWIDQWIQQNNIKHWALLQGGYDTGQPIDYTRCAYRPWWIYHRDLKYNRWQSLSAVEPRSFMFDVLLGSRRPNRDFVMLSLQQHQLLNKNLVTYRDVFTGSVVDDRSQQVKLLFPDQVLQWPYVSANLPTEWEVAAQMTNSVSQHVPWTIYQNSWYSVAAESVCDGSIFFMAEKISKPMFAQRPFLVFGIKGFLAQLRQLGYQTFGDVIDESYDTIDDNHRRWSCAFDQLVKLHLLDPVEVYAKLRPVLEHNHRHLSETESRARNAVNNLLSQHIPEKYVTQDQNLD